jgi:hypothetical protein
VPDDLRFLILRKVFPYQIIRAGKSKSGVMIPEGIAAVTPWGRFAVIGPHIVPIIRKSYHPPVSNLISWMGFDGPKEWSPPEDWDVYGFEVNDE